MNLSRIPLVEMMPEQRIVELKRKIQQSEYIQNALQEIASLLTEGINKSHFVLYERK